MLRRLTGKIGTPSLQPKSKFRSFVLENRFYSKQGGLDQPAGGKAPGIQSFGNSRHLQ
jgi:hypothetical protein